jgi:hypothetical protein
MIPEFKTESQVLNLIYEEVAGTPVVRTRVIGIEPGAEGAGAMGAVMIQDRTTDRRADVVKEDEEYAVRTSLTTKTVRRLVSSQFVKSGEFDLQTGDFTLFLQEDDSYPPIPFYQFPHRIQTMMLSFERDEPKTITFRIKVPGLAFEGFQIKPFLQDLVDTPDREFALWNDPIELSSFSYLQMHITQTPLYPNRLRYYFVIQAMVER